jgi:hypothetical protein
MNDDSEVVARKSFITNADIDRSARDRDRILETISEQDSQLIVLLVGTSAIIYLSVGFVAGWAMRGRGWVVLPYSLVINSAAWAQWLVTKLYSGRKFLPPVSKRKESSSGWETIIMETEFAHYLLS